MKVNNAAVQCDIQLVGGDDKFNDVGKFALVCCRFAAPHFTLRLTSLASFFDPSLFWHPIVHLQAGGTAQGHFQICCD